MVVTTPIIATVIAVKLVVERSAMRGLTADVMRGRELFMGLAAERRAQLAREARVVSDEPRLKAVMSSDVDPRTVRQVAHDVHEVVGTDMFMLVDPGGVLLFDLLLPGFFGADMSSQELIMRALTDGSAAGIMVDDEALYEVHAQRMSFGERTIGAVLLGRVIDHPVAAAIHAQADISALVLVDTRAVAVSPLPGAGPIDRERITGRLGAVELDAAAPVEVEVEVADE